MRISDWSSDVCSSDLQRRRCRPRGREARDDDHRSVAPPDLHVTDPVRSPSTRRAGASEEAAGEGLAVARGAGILCAEHLEQVDVARSEERCVGKECVSTFRSRWARFPEKKKTE